MDTITKAIAKFKGGVKIPHNKNTAENESVFMEPPKIVMIPMQQHIGAVCVPTVKKGDIVTVGQVIGDSADFVSAPIHASVSGKVKGIKPLLMANGKTCDAIHIASDGLPVEFPEARPVEIHSKEDLLTAARTSGLVGIGGAGFPMHVKLQVKEETPIDTLVINGAECEPYITSDYRESLEYPERIIAGMQVIMKYLQIPHGIVGIESNKPKGLHILRQRLNELADEDPKIDVMEIPSLYPQGAEKMLVYATTGRKIPPGKLPSEVGCLIMNISTISLFQRYLETGRPLTHKRVTVDGNVAEPKNVVVPIGTSIGEVIDFCGGLRSEPSKVVLGGPMMGISQYALELPITKQTNAITILSEAQHLPEESPCIRCGRCVEACPMLLLPVQIERCTRNQDVAGLKRLNVSACMECGCCAYVCPAGRRLVQSMKQAKLLVREVVK
ncbi:electron transport complex subunit RsxC [Enterococcus pseudoavium]|uniref:electron transport complex subunit RsxC n=1 Tax=Enterococcus pseudoavium TaxID=44007 RepID=UPI003F96AC8A